MAIASVLVEMTGVAVLAEDRDNANFYAALIESAPEWRPRLEREIETALRQRWPQLSFSVQTVVYPGSLKLAHHIFILAGGPAVAKTALKLAGAIAAEVTLAYFRDTLRAVLAWSIVQHSQLGGALLPLIGWLDTLIDELQRYQKRLKWRLLFQFARFFVVIAALIAFAVYMKLQGWDFSGLLRALGR